jgi:hypothetical protein
MQSNRIAASVIAAATITSVVATEGPAGAKVVEHLQAVDEPYSFTNEDCGTPYDVVGVFNGNFILRQGTGPATEAFPFLDRARIEETWTNTLTGRSFTLSRHGVFHEVKARPVEGTVFEFRAVETGQTTIVDENGNLVARNRGALVITFEFDTLGDGAPGGVYDFSTWVEDPRGPHPAADLCAIADELTS